MSDGQLNTSQSDNNLSLKREEARLAMSLKNNPASETKVDNQDNQVKKEVIVDKQDSIRLAEQRLKAKMAMEGEERRKKREEELRKTKEAEEKVRQEEERRKREEFEKTRIEKELREKEERAYLERKKISGELQKQVEEIKTSDNGLRGIRTLKVDTDNLIKNQNLSLVGIAIKEEERRKQNIENRSLTSKKNIYILLASLILVLLGIGTAVFVYLKFYKNEDISILSTGTKIPEPLIFTEKSRELDITGLSTEDITTRIKNEVRNPPDLLIGAMENLVFKQEKEKQKTDLSTNEFLSIIGSQIPDNLLRTLDKKFMFGILSSAENAGFVIFITESYDKGLAGLLEWENKNLTKDLYHLLTTLRPESELLTKPYEDMVLRNIDTRILRDKTGEIRLVYGFLDGNKNFIIAGSRQAFIEALLRFNTPKPITR